MSLDDGATGGETDADVRSCMAATTAGTDDAGGYGVLVVTERTFRR